MGVCRGVIKCSQETQPQGMFESQLAAAAAVDGVQLQRCGTQLAASALVCSGVLGNLQSLKGVDSVASLLVIQLLLLAWCV